MYVRSRIPHYFFEVAMEVADNQEGLAADIWLVDELTVKAEALLV